jgi:3-methyladenine DNA glycosylase/8-oxoguanine DNA glycosylase
VQRVWKIEGPIDLRQTLRFVLPKTGSSSGFPEDDVVFATRTGQGPATVTLSIVEDSLVGRALGSGADEALENVPRIVGLDDNPAIFRPGTGPLRDLHLRNRGLRLGSTGRVFDAALPTILGQRVTKDEATKSYRQLVRTFGDGAPGAPGLWLPPRAEVVAALRYEDFHRFGVERARAEIVIEVARRATRLEEIGSMERADAIRRLAAVRGLGPWTVAQIMGTAWGDRDAIPRGDFHLPNTVSWLLAGEPRGTDDQMEELLEPYRPYRRRAMLLIKLSAVHAPRYGPRSLQGTIGQYNS